ncbi:hypothetical protein [Falsibacillus pallidus]|uniref:hypothetical protein n=1 Tax=Falsibacillus pallidus TaxID=493781 RepID=UPI003D998A20
MGDKIALDRGVFTLEEGSYARKTLAYARLGMLYARKTTVYAPERVRYALKTPTYAPVGFPNLYPPIFDKNRVVTGTFTVLC